MLDLQRSVGAVVDAASLPPQPPSDITNVELKSQLPPPATCANTCCDDMLRRVCLCRACCHDTSLMLTEEGKRQESLHGTGCEVVKLFSPISHPPSYLGVSFLATLRPYIFINTNMFIYLFENIRLEPAGLSSIILTPTQSVSAPISQLEPWKCLCNFLKDYSDGFIQYQSVQMWILK